jgi:hypothetical protein
LGGSELPFVSSAVMCEKGFAIISVKSDVASSSIM